MLDSILPSNDAQLERAINSVLELQSGKIGVFGLTFKENTDDLRESPTIALLERLIGKGVEIRVYDPNLALDKIHGANQQFLMERIPHIGRLMEPDLDDLLGWADHVVRAQKPKGAAVERLRTSGKPVLNLVGGAPLG
ncbi:MAG: UDP binding domain-containing protein [Bryobacterales bacterium]